MEYKTPFRNYNKIISENGIWRCKSCASKNNNDVRVQKRNPEHYSRFVCACNEKNYIPVTTIDEMEGINTNVKYICPVHGLRKIKLERLLNGAGCRKCADDIIGLKSRLHIEEVINAVESKNNDHLLNPEDYKTTGTKNLKIVCGSCGDIFLSSLSSIMNGNGRCRKCANEEIGKKLIKKEEHINRVINSIPGVCILNIDDYQGAYTKNLYVKCVECGDVFLSSYTKYINAGINRCKKCVSKSSYGEYYISQYLTSHSIPFTQEKRFDDCKDKKPLPFDFYLPDHNMCIEFDGIQHRRPVRGYLAYDRTKRHDKMKDDYCLKNGIKLLRISSDDFDNIDIILSNELQFVQKI